MRHAHLTLGCLLLVAGCGGGLQEVPRDLDGEAEPRPRRAVAKAAPQAAAAPAIEKPAAPPPEPVPERLGTPASSRAKKPAWSMYSGEYAPQAPWRAKLFDESSGPLQGEQVGLVCRLGISSTTRHGGFAGLPD